jgi:hypothetical protein
MKQINIGNLTFSKVICGTNAFYGHSHFSEARDAEYLARFDEETIARTIRRSLDLGVNTVESCANERIVSILSSLRKEISGPVHFVGSTRIDETSDMKRHKDKLAFLIEHRADICVVHAQYVDRPGQADVPAGLERYIDQIHEAGLLAGISTHRIQTVEICEKRDLGIDTYLFPLNLSGFVYPGYEGNETVRDRVDLIRGVPKPFILIKTLGAGRIPPEEGLSFIAENAKSTDIISLGFGTQDEVTESLKLAEKLF